METQNPMRKQAITGNIKSQRELIAPRKSFKRFTSFMSLELKKNQNFFFLLLSFPYTLVPGYR